MPPIDSQLTLMSWVAAFVAGTLSFFSPCTVPLLPAYLSYLTGASYEELMAKGVRRAVLVHSLFFLAGFGGVFVLLGASATYAGGFLADHSRAFEVVGGLILTFLGVFLLGWVGIPWLHREARWIPKVKPAGYAGSVLVGVAFAAGWSPCVGPILAAILLLASSTHQVWQGMALLAVYSLGFSIPFLISSLLLGRFMGWIRGKGRLFRAIEVASGLLLLVFGILLLGGWWRFLASWFLSKGFNSFL